MNLIQTSESKQFRIITGIIVVINDKILMGDYTAGYLLKALLGLAFLFSVLISYNGALAFYGQLG
jgi:hypothetical protein